MSGRPVRKPSERKRRISSVYKDVLHLGASLHTVFGASLLNHLDAAEGLDGAAKQFVGLQTYNQFAVLLDVAGSVRGDGRYGIGVERADAVVGALLFEGFQTYVPNAESALGGTYEERSVALVRGDVLANKVGNVDLLVPRTFDEVRKDIHSAI